VLNNPACVIVAVLTLLFLEQKALHAAPVAIPVEASEVWLAYDKRLPDLSGTLTITDRRKLGDDPESVRTTERQIKLSATGATLQFPHPDSQTRTFGSNPRYSFVLTRKSGNPDYLLDDL
jgi:hypothetical protein